MLYPMFRWGGGGHTHPRSPMSCVCVWGGGTHHTRSHPPKKGHGTRVPTLPSWTDRHLWKHYLPATSLAGGNNSAFIRYTRRFPCLVILLLNPTVTLIEINRAMADATDHWKKNRESMHLLNICVTHRTMVSSTRDDYCLVKIWFYVRITCPLKIS